jgi:CRISPR/Cas system-associated exonuclease Cas4 (RecB family)
MEISDEWQSSKAYLSLSENAEQEVSVKLGMDYLKDDTTISVNYERVQSTNNKAHSDGVEGTLRWKF